MRVRQLPMPYFRIARSCHLWNSLVNIVSTPFLILLYHRKGVLSTPFRLFLRDFFQNRAETGADAADSQQNQNNRQMDMEKNLHLVPDFNDGEIEQTAENQQADDAGDDILDGGLHN